MSATESTTLVPELRYSSDAPEHLAQERAALSRSHLAALPSFFIAGPPRTGTTWLHAVLNRHVSLPSPTKETRFFDLNFRRGLVWYLRRFPSPSHGRPRGEVAPTYFASQIACERIAGTLPEAKIIFIFRHPVERLISLYRLKRAYGLLEWDIDTALERDPELIESARYATHLANWNARFPASQLEALLYDDLAANPQGFVDRVADFIGIPRFALRESEMAQVAATHQLSEPRHFLATRAATATASWCKSHSLDRVVAGVRRSPLMKFFVGGGAPFSQIPAGTLEHIFQLVLPEIEQLEAMLQRDLSAWKTLPAQRSAGGQRRP